MKIEKIVLEGHYVRLEPLAQSHLPGLARAIEDGELWKLPVTVVPQPKDLQTFYPAAEAAFAAGVELTFATLDKRKGVAPAEAADRALRSTTRIGSGCARTR